MSVNFEVAFHAVGEQPGVITTILSSDHVVKYISKNISSLGWKQEDLVGTNGYTLLKESSSFYLRPHRKGIDILMETISLVTAANGDIVMVERLVGNDNEIIEKNKLPFLPTHSVSKVPRFIIQDFVVNGTVGIHWVQPDGTIAWANQADMAICGYRPDEYIGSSVTNYHVDADVLQDILTRLTNNEVLKEYKARLRHKDGTIRHVVIDSSANIDANGNFINTRCFTRDITEARELELQKQAAQIEAKLAQEALEKKSLFLARMSHDIRTPLNGVIGMTSLLQTTSLTPEQVDFLNTIESSSNFLVNLLQDILDHSKIEAGKIDLDPIPQNLAKLTEECASILRVESARKDIDLILNVPTDPSLYHMVDSNRLKQIILNFLSNAIKFTPKGSVTATVDIRPYVKPVVNEGQAPEEPADSKPRDHVTISVEDTGIGIADVSGLFTEFKQATKSTTREYGGTGLGLSIAKSLTELMGGKIGIESEFGKGTKMITEFVFERAAEENIPIACETVGAIPTSKELLLHWKEKCNILIAEDNKINQKVLLNMMKRLGYKKLTVANNGQLAVDEYKASIACSIKYDLILMDCLMPELSGMEATHEIRRLENESGVNEKDRIPIIALTANAQVSDRRECIQCGMDGFLSKPVKLEPLDEELVKYFVSH